MENSKESFFSMDRLIEFGMGMALSQQIVRSMNSMMSQMQQPPLAQNVYQPGQQQIRQPVYQQYAQQQQVSNNAAAFSQAGKDNTPPAPPPLPSSEEKTKVEAYIPELFYIYDGKESSGPFSGLEIARLVTEKKVTAETMVWKSGTSEWKKAQDFDQLLALIALVPPELPEEK